MASIKRKSELASPIPIKLTNQQVKALRAKAKELDISMASLIRQAVREFLAE